MKTVSVAKRAAQLAAATRSSAPRISVRGISTHLVQARSRPEAQSSSRICCDSSLASHVRYHSTQHAGPSSQPIPEIAPEDTYDIVIIGAANAGLALACALCMSNHHPEWKSPVRELK